MTKTRFTSALEGPALKDGMDIELFCKHISSMDGLVRAVGKEVGKKVSTRVAGIKGSDGCFEIDFVLEERDR